MQKRLLVAGRARRVPKQFSWIDGRLVRGGYLRGCKAEALALYLVLVTVGDEAGLSYYSDRSLSGLLSIDERALCAARRDLLSADLIAYQKPLYQVLSLEAEPVRRATGPQTVAEVLRGVLETRR